ncbi:PREDICTED: trichohyalin-like isoform X2 [Priapulus caudatus]|uniref:Trichohyalin-like isoform X2 n=1 Tax=Priapulus caudatus TaxID=37621 RepID=A0ABM1DZV1_PRICU|nr:PREDICTED: trichohyalin-like isoform X2 [Priapulus caudatus]
MDVVPTHQTETLRRAYKQQLADAIAKFSATWKKYYETQMSGGKQKLELQLQQLRKDKKHLLGTIHKKDAIIEMLREQAQTFVSESTLTEMGEEEEEEEKEDQIEVNPESLISSEDLQKLEEEVRKWKKDALHLQREVKQKDDTIDALRTESETQEKQLASERKLSEQMEQEIQRLQQLIEREKETQRKMMELQMRNIEKEMESHMMNTKKALQAQAAKDHQALKDMERQRQLLDDKVKKQVEDAQEKQIPESGGTAHDWNQAKRVKKLLEVEIERLKSELKKTNYKWEKKCAILQQSIHALKDESYLRQSLHRQTTSIRYATVAYGYCDSPLGIVPSQPPIISSKKPLPNISKTRYPGDHISCADNNVGPFVTDSGSISSLALTKGDQIMTEEELQDLGVPLLPSPPIRDP